VRRVSDGHVYLSEDMTDALLGMAFGSAADTANPTDRLSDREFEVFRTIGLGQSVRTISEQLHIYQSEDGRISPNERQGKAAPPFRRGVLPLRDRVDDRTQVKFRLPIL